WSCFLCPLLERRLMARGVRIMGVTAASTAGSTRLSNVVLPYRASVDFAVQIHFQQTPEEKREHAIDATSSNTFADVRASGRPENRLSLMLKDDSLVR